MSISSTVRPRPQQVGGGDEGGLAAAGDDGSLRAAGVGRGEHLVDAAPVDRLGLHVVGHRGLREAERAAGRARAGDRQQRHRARRHRGERRQLAGNEFQRARAGLLDGDRRELTALDQVHAVDVDVAPGHEATEAGALVRRELGSLGVGLQREQAVAWETCLCGQVGGLLEADRQLLAREQEEAVREAALGDPGLVVAGRTCRGRGRSSTGPSRSTAAVPQGPEFVRRASETQGA